ncbi:hypothetical protein [Bradyrhizobium liaoningense]|uniref:hypothetical protein n=1 Tax=Bradyrhizobium liaoningense TaxID=43992 RepID=UPI001BADE33B|nr:hypothetical protein [Bradyrhizobium liaoningense]MBR1070300.1 hypothetical protein [Bradyrhizobium liaoningense]
MKVSRNTRIFSLQFDEKSINLKQAQLGARQLPTKRRHTEVVADQNWQRQCHRQAPQ